MPRPMLGKDVAVTNEGKTDVPGGVGKARYDFGEKRPVKPPTTSGSGSVLMNNLSRSGLT
jgi:hypothetical protein